MDGVPIMSCALVVAHLALHSGRHSWRDFCSSAFGLVHSYMHNDTQDWNAGSAFVPFVAARSSLADAADTGRTVVIVVVATTMIVWKNSLRDIFSACRADAWFGGDNGRKAQLHEASKSNVRMYRSMIVIWFGRYFSVSLVYFTLCFLIRFLSCSTIDYDIATTKY